MLSKVQHEILHSENAIGRVHSFQKEIIPNDMKAARLWLPRSLSSTTMWHGQGACLLPEVLPAAS